MTYLTPVVFVVFIGLVQLSPVPYKPLNTEEMMKVALHCIDEVKIDRAIIEKVLKTQILPRDDKKYKEYLECSYKRQGFLSADGKQMLYENLFTFLERFYNREDLASLGHCKLIRQEDAGELCFRNLDCILEGLRNIEAEEEMVTNDIEEE